MVSKIAVSAMLAWTAAAHAATVGERLGPGEAAANLTASLGMEDAEWETAEFEDGILRLTGLRWRGTRLEAKSDTVESAEGSLQLHGLHLISAHGSLTAERATVESGDGGHFTGMTSNGVVVSYGGSVWSVSDLAVNGEGWKDGLPSNLALSMAGDGWKLETKAVTNMQSGRMVADFAWGPGEFGQAIARVDLGGLDHSWQKSFLALLSGTAGDEDSARVTTGAQVLRLAAAFRGFGWLREAGKEGMLTDFLDGKSSRALVQETELAAGMLRDANGDVSLLYEPTRPLTFWSLFSTESMILPDHLGRKD